eukprot:10838599-Alexandrium_andersonii.AAC.1
MQAPRPCRQPSPRTCREGCGDPKRARADARWWETRHSRRALGPADAARRPPGAASPEPRQWRSDHHRL